jgi:hypothetical protein
MKEIIRQQNTRTHLVNFLPASVLGVSWLLPGAPLDELGMIRTRMGTHNRSGKGRSFWDALCDTTP